MADEYAKNERERDNAVTRLEVRAEMRSSNELEDTGVINLRADEVQALKAAESERPPEKATVWAVAYAAVRRVPPLGIVFLGTLGILAYVYLATHGAK